MKHIRSKIYIIFISVFLLMLVISSFSLYNAYQMYKENYQLQKDSLELGQKVLRLEVLITNLNILGQRHIETVDEGEMEQYNIEIENNYNKLTNIIEQLLSYEENRKDRIYTRFSNRWKLYWGIYKTMIALSNNNRDEEALRWLIKANDEMDELHRHYLEPIINDTYQDIANRLDLQKKNYHGFLGLGCILLIVLIVGYLLAFRYLKAVLKQSRLQNEKLEFYAYYDELTKVLNRRMFKRKVEGLIEKADEKFAIFYLDIDKFKYINDNFGHDVGDSVIVEFVNRIQSSLRDEDIIGRLGGDEFIILVREENEDEIMELAGKIIHSFDKPLIIEGESYQISTSIGIVLYPAQGEDYKTLIKKADIALYEAKEQRNIYKLSSE